MTVSIYNYKISEEELRKLVGAFCPMTRFDKERLEDFLKSKKPIKPSKCNVDIVVGELKKLWADYHKGVYLCENDYKMWARDLLSKLNIEYATPEKFREIIKAFLKKNIREALYDVLPFEDLVKELSQLAKLDYTPCYSKDGELINEPDDDNLFPEARSATPEEHEAEKEWKKKKFKTIDLADDKVIAEGEMFYEENFMSPSHYYLWGREKMAIRFDDKINDKLKKTTGNKYQLILRKV